MKCSFPQETDIYMYGPNSTVLLSKPSMELFTALIGVFLALYMLIKVIDSCKSSKPSPKLPPGPKPLPIIGNLHQLLGAQTHHILRDLAKRYGSLMHLQLGEVSTLIVSSPEAAEQFMKTHDTIFSYRPLLLSPRILNYDCTDIAFAPLGDYWRQLRRICTMELLSPKRVQSFRSLREEEVLNLIRSIHSQKGTAINFSRIFFSFTYGLVAQAAFGKKGNYTAKFISVVEESTKLASGFNIADLYPSNRFIQFISEMSPKLKRTFKRSDEVLENILNDHRQKRIIIAPSNGETKEDLVDVLLKIQKSGDFGAPLTDNNIKAVIMDIFSAGSETSSTTVEWAMSEMLKNPRVMKAAQDEVRKVFNGRGNVDESSLNELKYLQAVVKETLRLHPPAPLLLPRECSEQCKINEYDVPIKTRVIINAWAIGRDSKYWNEAEKFIPERFLDNATDYHGKDFKYIPFGAGRRICPGISFAQADIELPLAQLLYHFDWKLPNELKHEELDMTEAFALTVRRRNDLFLIPVPYAHSFLESSD